MEILATTKTSSPIHQIFKIAILLLYKFTGDENPHKVNIIEVFINPSIFLLHSISGRKGEREEGEPKKPSLTETEVTRTTKKCQ